MMTSLLQKLNERSCGLSYCGNLKKYILQYRCNNLIISNLVDFEPVHVSAINCLDVDREGRYLLSGTKAGSMFIHDLYNFTGTPSYRCKLVFGVENKFLRSGLSQSIETVQWYPFDSGMFVTSGLDCAVRFWDTDTMKIVNTIKFSSKIYQHHIATFPSKRVPLIAVASTSSEVMLVDMQSGQSTHELRGHSSFVMCCAWSPTSEYLLATGSFDCTVKLWDIRAANNQLATLDMRNRRSEDVSVTNPAQSHNGPVNGIAFTPDGKLLMSLGTDDTLHCWNIDTYMNQHITYGVLPNRRTRVLKFQIFGYENFNLCFLPSGSTIVIYEVETGKKVNTLTGHYNLVNACYFQKDRMELYSGGLDRSILLWTHTEDPSPEGSFTRPVKPELESEWIDSDEPVFSHGAGRGQIIIL